MNGIHAMGGMAAQIPIRGDDKANNEALEKVRQDKLGEVKNGQSNLVRLEMADEFPVHRWIHFSHLGDRLLDAVFAHGWESDFPDSDDGGSREGLGHGQDPDGGRIPSGLVRRQSNSFAHFGQTPGEPIGQAFRRKMHYTYYLLFAL